jgi:putative transposase
MMRTVYPSDLTAEQFALLEELIPPAKPGGRPRTVAIWAVLNAILYILVEGVRWRALPGDFPPWQTVYTYVRMWRNDGTWLAMYDQLRGWERIEQYRFPTPSEGVLDSQSVKSASGLQLAVGYDSAKRIKGRKRFALVDTLGLILRVQVMAANVGERDGVKQVLQRAKQQMGKQLKRFHTVWVDGGFDGAPFLMWVMDSCRWIVQVVLRPNESQGFVVVKKRWVVERTFGWLMQCRRLVRDYEQLPETSETFIYIAMIRILVRRLA